MIKKIIGLIKNIFSGNGQGCTLIKQRLIRTSSPAPTSFDEPQQVIISYGGKVKTLAVQMAISSYEPDIAVEYAKKKLCQIMADGVSEVMDFDVITEPNGSRTITGRLSVVVKE